MERKKILVNLVSERLEKLRSHLEKQWGSKVSNSQMLDHVVFYYLTSHGLESLPLMDVEPKKMFLSTPPKERRSPLRSLMDAYKETKK